MSTKPRPVPQQCRHCHNDAIVLTKIDYDAENRCGGYLHKFTVHDLEILICQACGEKIFTKKVDEQIQKGLRAHLLSIIINPTKTEDTMKIIIDAAYEWRSADVNEAACRLGIREDGIPPGMAAKELEEKLRNLRVILDMFREEHK